MSVVLQLVKGAPRYGRIGAREHALCSSGEAGSKSQIYKTLLYLYIVYTLLNMFIYEVPPWTLGGPNRTQTSNVEKGDLIWVEHTRYGLPTESVPAIRKHLIFRVFVIILSPLFLFSHSLFSSPSLFSSRVVNLPLFENQSQKFVSA